MRSLNNVKLSESGVEAKVVSKRIVHRATENARNENSAPSKMQVVKIRDMKMGEIKIWEKCDFGLGEH